MAKTPDQLRNSPSGLGLLLGALVEPIQSRPRPNLPAVDPATIQARAVQRIADRIAQAE